MGMLVNWLVLIALGIPGRFSIAAVLLVLLQMGGRVPGVPASIGIFEALCIIGLGWFAIGPGLGLGYGVALHAVVLLPGLVGGAFVLWRDSVARVGLQQITGRGAGSA
jgi:uncharacterized membrane protein YbhN (UPF0104 family)